MRKLRRILTFFVALLPASHFKNIVMNLLKHNDYASAKFCPNIIFGECKITIGRESLVRRVGGSSPSQPIIGFNLWNVL